MWSGLFCWGRYWLFLVNYYHGVAIGGVTVRITIIGVAIRITIGGVAIRIPIGGVAIRMAILLCCCCVSAVIFIQKNWMRYDFYYALLESMYWGVCLETKKGQESGKKILLFQNNLRSVRDKEMRDDDYLPGNPNPNNNNNKVTHFWWCSYSENVRETERERRARKI